MDILQSIKEVLAGNEIIAFYISGRYLLDSSLLSFLILDL